MFSLSARKILLSIHILLVSVWVGISVALLLLLVFKYSTLNVYQNEVLDMLVFLLFDNIIMNVSIAVAITGLLFSIFTKWGFIKFYWITTKWVILIVLAILIMFFVSPAVNGMASLSDIFKEQSINNAQYKYFEGRTILYLGIQLMLLIFVVFISVLKPWGQRITRRSINRRAVVTFGILIGITLSTSAIVQYVQIYHYRNLPVNEVNLEIISDGYYVGKVDYVFEYEVGVYIENHSISDIKILKNRDSHYARLGEGIKHKIIREQKININAVTGATTTSKILLKAVEVAIRPEL